MLESLWCDVRSAARAMRTHPITAAVAIATLAAGISVNTTVFAIAGAVRRLRCVMVAPRQVTSGLMSRRSRARRTAEASRRASARATARPSVESL